MRNFFRYAKNRFLYNLLRILIIVSIGFIIGSCEVKADEITSFDFMDKGNTSFMIGANGSVNGTFSIVVEDMTQIKPYVNLLVATTGYSDFLITENDYFSNTVIKKLYSSGTTNIDSYSADLYVVQFSTRGTGWNCSSSGLNCYVNTQLRLFNPYSYNAYYQLKSIALTDSVLTDDYLANMQINQNNQIIEQGKQTNDKLDNLDQTIKDTNQDLQDSITDSNQHLQDSITEGNKETQEVIKDQFNSCRESKNLLDISKFGAKTANGMSASINSDKTLTFTGTTTALTNYWFSNLNLKLEAGTYYFSSNVNLSGKGLYRLTDENNNNVFNGSSSGSFSVTDTTIITGLIQINSGVAFNNTTFKLMISSTSGNWEPYGEEICSNKLDEQNETSKGIWATIKDLPNQFLNMLKGLIIPDNFDFIYEFQDALENKLGFIASIPLQFIEFLLNLATASWEEVTSITLPEIEMFGVKWWNGTEIDISEGLKMFEAIKYFTDILCVILMVNTLHKWYESFTGGGH